MSAKVPRGEKVPLLNSGQQALPFQFCGSAQAGLNHAINRPDRCYVKL
jgi:hypothetical protein